MREPHDDSELVLALARDLYGRVVFTHKTHEKQREIWGAQASRLTLVNVGLVSATTFFAIYSAILKPVWSLLLTAILATMSTSFIVWQASFDPVGKENQHRVAAKELLWIREQLIQIIRDCHLQVADIVDLRRRFELISREVTAVYKFAPDTSPEAYAKAKAALLDGEFTFEKEELDRLLPNSLRQAKRS